MNHSSLIIVFSTVTIWSWQEDFNEFGREIKKTPKEEEQCQEEEEKEEEEDVKGQTKWEENKERVYDRVTETYFI